MTKEYVFHNIAEPPREFSPVPIWWWSGDEVTEERLKWQMEKMIEGGIYNAMIMNVAPSAPMYGKDIDNPEFMNERWWELFEFACKTAGDMGMYIWFYDQIGFSGANFQAQLVKMNTGFAGQKLESKVVYVDKAGEVRCPNEGILLAAFSQKLDDNGKDIADYKVLAIHENTVYVDTGKQKVRMVYHITAGFDYFSVEACAALLDCIHGEFDRHSRQWYGKVIVGSFQDELPPMPLWGTAFEEEFKIKKGYDILPVLLYLWEGEGVLAERTRRDYQDVRAKLAEQSFFIPFYEWHRDRGLSCGIDQGGLARGGHVADSVFYYADYINTQRWYDIPGSDLMGNAKIHSSIANIYGRKRVWLEAFHSTGWGGSLEETFDWLLPWYRAGANLYNPHAFYYSTKGGFWEWAPPSTCWRQPYWKHYKQFADATSRMSYLLSGGSHVCNIALLYPTTAAQSFYTLDYERVGMAGISEEVRQIQNVYEDMIGVTNMYGNPHIGVFDDCGRDYDIISEFMLSEEAIIDNKIIVGDLEFEMLVLPNCTTVTIEAAKALVKFVNQGGQLAAVRAIPHAVDADGEAVFLELKQLFDSGKATLVNNAEEFRPILIDMQPSAAESPVGTIHRRKGSQNILFVPAAKLMGCEDYNVNPFQEGDPVYNFNYDNYNHNMEITLFHTDADIYQVNLITGETEAAIFEKQGSDMKVKLLFREAPAAILLWDESWEKLGISNQEKEYESMKTLGDIWDYKLDLTMDNKYGDFTKPDFDGFPAPATWFFQHQKGERITDNWEEVHATFGQQAFSLKGKADELPGGVSNQDLEKVYAQTRDWEPVVYSKSRGIDKDRIHASTLGPSGHIPEEYMDFGSMDAGQGIQVRTGIWSENEEIVQLAVGSPTKKRIWVNGMEISAGEAAYLVITPITLLEGCNVIDIQYIAEYPVRARGYWSFIEDAEDFIRPEWLKTDDVPEIHDKYIFTYDLDLDKIPVQADISYGTTCCLSRFIVNGEEQDRMGGFKPYDSEGIENGICHPVNWIVGKNKIEFEITIKSKGYSSLLSDDKAGAGDATSLKGLKACVFLDALLTFADGTTENHISGDGWKVLHSNGKVINGIKDPYAKTGRSGANSNPAVLFIRKRPCTLPGFEWIEDETAKSISKDVRNDPFFGHREEEWFKWKIPSAASRARIDIAGEAVVYVDGKECEYQNGFITLPGTVNCYYEAVMKVIPDYGYTGGALFYTPVEYEHDTVGHIALGEWGIQALESYSGGIIYKTTFEWNKACDGNYMISLGKVRGTAEVRVNGRTVGERFLSPYEYNLQDTLVQGSNMIEVMVYNTLAPYMYATSPTHFVSSNQRVSGMMGPVTILKVLSGKSRGIN